MLTFAINTLLLILYAAFIVTFTVLLFVQFRLTLMLWRFIYAAVGFRLWDGLRTDSAYKQKLRVFQKSTPFIALKRKWRRAATWVLISFVLFFGAVALVSTFAPTILERNWLFI